MSEEHVLIRSEQLLEQLLREMRAVTLLLHFGQFRPRLLEQLLREMRAVLREVRAIRREVTPHKFTLQLTMYTGDGMSSPVLPITSLPLGGSAQLVAQLLENGAPYIAPAGPTLHLLSLGQLGQREHHDCAGSGRRDRRSGSAGPAVPDHRFGE